MTEDNQPALIHADELKFDHVGMLVGAFSAAHSRKTFTAGLLEGIFHYLDNDRDPATTLRIALTDGKSVDLTLGSGTVAIGWDLESLMKKALSAMDQSPD
ncbi:hypothetical protein [Williamsia herbipolensis]|uniref:hypothetical protein n=1 Tax=Williamsia herbipolensis TaxID=1603258 RepID=UPI0005F8590D|nr:hypothetical protein [Williamsia herbipolensis]